MLTPDDIKMFQPNDNAADLLVYLLAHPHLKFY